MKTSIYLGVIVSEDLSFCARLTKREGKSAWRKQLVAINLLSPIFAIVLSFFPHSALATYVQSDVLSSGGTCFQPNFDLCRGDTGQLQQASTEITRSFGGSTTWASANLETQELRAKTEGDGAPATNQAQASFAETYLFAPLIAPADAVFTYTFEGTFSDTTLSPQYPGCQTCAILQVREVNDSAGNNYIFLENTRLLWLYDGTLSTNGSATIEHILTLPAGISSLEISMVLSIQELLGGTIDVSNTAGYTVAFAEEIGEVTRASGLPLSPVPIPAAAWLFGSALAGLFGVGRMRKEAA